MNNLPTLSNNSSFADKGNFAVELHTSMARFRDWNCVPILSLENVTLFFIHFFKFRNVWNPLKAKPLFCLCLFFLYAQSTPFHSSTRETKLQDWKKKKPTPEQVLPQKGLGRNNLTIEKYILLWKAKWTLLLSVEIFWIYGTYSLSFKPSRKFSKPTLRLRKT